ncbi:hypothetical protein [Oceanobacillus kapialis]
MFDLVNQISSKLSGKLQQIAYSFERLPFLFAFFLRVIGVVPTLPTYQ